MKGLFDSTEMEDAPKGLKLYCHPTRHQPAPLLKGSSKPWFYCSGLERVCFPSTEHWASPVGAASHPTHMLGLRSAASHPTHLLGLRSAALSRLDYLPFACSCLSFTLDRLVAHPVSAPPFPNSSGHISLGKVQDSASSAPFTGDPGPLVLPFPYGPSLCSDQCLDDSCRRLST